MPNGFLTENTVRELIKKIILTHLPEIHLELEADERTVTDWFVFGMI